MQSRCESGAAPNLSGARPAIQSGRVARLRPRAVRAFSLSLGFAKTVPSSAKLISRRSDVASQGGQQKPVVHIGVARQPVIGSMRTVSQRLNGVASYDRFSAKQQKICCRKFKIANNAAASI
jgi:hypothetical protein